MGLAKGQTRAPDRDLNTYLANTSHICKVRCHDLNHRQLSEFCQTLGFQNTWPALPVRSLSWVGLVRSALAGLDYWGIGPENAARPGNSDLIPIGSASWSYCTYDGLVVGSARYTNAREKLTGKKCSTAMFGEIPQNTAFNQRETQWHSPGTAEKILRCAATPAKFPHETPIKGHSAERSDDPINNTLLSDSALESTFSVAISQCQKSSLMSQRLIDSWLN